MRKLNTLVLSFTFVFAAALAPLPAQSPDYGYDYPEDNGPVRPEPKPNPMPPVALQAFDLTEDMSVGGKFVTDEAPFSAENLPKYGLPFVTGGYIYPAGTLQNGNGINMDGSPEFPSLVIGTWWCKGYFIADFTAQSQGPIVLTTQVFDFGDQPGEMTMTTEGLESATVGEEIKRAITGGTGPYRNVRGQIRQELLGVNQTEGVNLRIMVDARGAN